MSKRSDIWNHFDNIGGDDKARCKFYRAEIGYRVMTTAIKDVVTEYCVVLLDGNRLEIVAEPEALAAQLLDVISSKIGLRENVYFGLAYYDSYGNCHWLQNERRLGEHDLPGNRQPLILYFLVRFFVPSFMVVTDSWAIILMYLHVRQIIWTSQLECDINTAVDLASYVLQAAYGDYAEDISIADQLHFLSLLPSCLLKDSSLLKHCERQILERYQNNSGMSRGLAVVSYLSIVEKLPTYGSHYYSVKDKKGVSWLLGISWRGIGVYDHSAPTLPRKIFAWKQLENIYFHEKKFSIEVVDPRTSTTSVQTQDSGRIKVKVYTWHVATSRLTNTVWNMSVTEHQFYLEWKHAKSKSARLLSEVVDDLNQTIDSDPNVMSLLATETVVTFGGGGGGNVGHDLCQTVDQSIIDCGVVQHDKSLSSKDAEAAKAAQLAKCLALKEKKKLLEEQLNRKLEELYSACAKEAGITGVVPRETPHIHGKPPLTIPKKMGTEFTVPAKFFSPDKEPGKAGELDLQFEIQKQQMEAVLKLSQDKSLARSVRRKYRQQYKESHLKLKQLEERLNAYRKRVGRSLVNIPDTVEVEYSEDSQEFLDCPDPDDLLSPQPSDGTHDSADTGSLASQQSCQSEGQIRIHAKGRRSKSSVQLSHLSGSLPKMEVQEYDKPPVLMSPTRSVSSNSLKEQTSSAAQLAAAEIKIYPKMTHRSTINSPQVNPTYMYSYQKSQPSTYSIPSSLYSDSGVGSVYSSSSRKTSRRQARTSSSTSNIQKHPPSPNPSDCSDVSEGQFSRRSATSDDRVRHGMSKMSMTGSEPKVAYNSSSPAINNVFQSVGPATTVDSDEVKSPETYEDGTRTWPRKRGNRSNRRRQSEEGSQPESLPMASTPVAEVSTTPMGLNDSLDLAELSPSKYGCKRDSTVDRRDSPHFAYSPYTPQSGSCYYGSDPNVGRAEDSLSRSSRQSTGGHYSSNPYSYSSESDRHRPHNVSITPLQWNQSPVQSQHSFDDDGRAEHILLSQGRRQSSSSSSARGRRGETTPAVETQTMYEPYRYGVAGVITGNPFSFTPTPRPFAAMPYHASPAATYSPNMAAGRTTSSASSSLPGNKHAVDALFDNIYKTDDVSSPFGPSTPGVSSGRPTPLPAPHWCEPTIRGQSASTSRRTRSHASSGYATLPTPPQIMVTSSSSTMSGTSSRHRTSLPNQTIVWRSPPQEPPTSSTLV